MRYITVKLTEDQMHCAITALHWYYNNEHAYKPKGFITRLINTLVKAKSQDNS